jgi:hypothetical protein
LHQFKPEDAAVKRERTFQIGYLQVDVPDHHPLVDASIGLMHFVRDHDFANLILVRGQQFAGGMFRIEVS